MGEYLVFRLKIERVPRSTTQIVHFDNQFVTGRTRDYIKTPSRPFVVPFISTMSGTVILRQF